MTSDDTTPDFTVDIAQTTGAIVAAFLSHNAMSPDRVADFIASTAVAVRAVFAPGEPQPEEVELEPAVPIRKSITPDAIICLEDGLKFKSLKRHLATHFDMTPEQYRARWGLPADYPMVAPNYSATRSQLAKNTGLGKRVPA